MKTTGVLQHIKAAGMVLALSGAIIVGPSSIGWASAEKEATAVSLATYLRSARAVISKNQNLVKNDGAVFGIGANRRMFFILFTFAALAAAVAVFGRWTTAGATVAHVAIALIIAGGAGNLYDRLQFGFVRDFLHMLPGWQLPFGWNWPGGNTEVFPWVFNMADTMLLFGMGTLMWYMNGLEKRRKVAREASGETASLSAP